MYINLVLKKIFLIGLPLLFLYSCDKEYNTIGSDLFGESNSDLLRYTSDVVAYNQKIGAVQSTNLSVNALGVYNNPAFGKTTAHFVTQLILASENPTFGTGVEIDSVYLSVPYFNTLLETNTDGSHKYRLDSIYGGDQAKLKLSVYESGYYIRNLDPATSLQEMQPFYTDERATFDNVKGGFRLNTSSNTNQNDAFFFNPNEIVLTTKDTQGKITTTRSAPAMRLKLDNDFFKTKILNAPAGKLATNDVFKDYFKGLYFKIEEVAGSVGSMAMLNFKAGKITVSYTEKSTDADGSPIKIAKTIDLNFIGNTVSFLEQSASNTDFTSAINNPNISGDANLYIKGGAEGSMAVINLFTTSGELAIIRSKGWLINEANLVFTIDAAKMANSSEPNRVYIYNLTHNQPVADYNNDATSSVSVKYAKNIFSGILNKETSSGRGKTYKIRITDQIRQLVKNPDSTNVKLGLVVTEDIREASFVKWKTTDNLTKKIPKASVMNPLGTILYGSHPSVPEDKRLKLQIYYTKTN